MENLLCPGLDTLPMITNIIAYYRFLSFPQHNTPLQVPYTTCLPQCSILLPNNPSQDNSSFQRAAVFKLVLWLHAMSSPHALTHLFSFKSVLFTLLSTLISIFSSLCNLKHLWSTEFTNATPCCCLCLVLHSCSSLDSTQLCYTSLSVREDGWFSCSHSSNSCFFPSCSLPTPFTITIRCHWAVLQNGQ